MIVDGTIVRVHQHGTGAKGGLKNQAIGRSRGGLTTKIVALVDALGNFDTVGHFPTLTSCGIWDQGSEF